jgi:uncharacterized protein
MRKICFIVLMLGIYSMGFTQALSKNDIAKQVITGFQKGNMDIVTKYFDEKMKTALTQEKLKTVWKDLNAQCGEFEKYSTLTTEKIENYDIVYVLCHFKNMNLKMKTVFNKQNQISGLFFVP